MPRRIKKSSRATRSVDTAIGDRLRERRIFLGMTQQELAEAIGLTFQQIQKYENGTNRIAVARLLELAVALKVSPLYFLKGLYAADAPAPGAPSSSKDGIVLLRAFDGIDSPALKKQLLTMAKSLSKSRAA